MLELLGGPLGLAGGLELGGHPVTQRDQQFDVEGGVDQPFLGQGAARPVGGGVLLGQGLAQGALEQGPKRHARKAQKAAGQLGVEQPAGEHVHLGEAGQVLAGGVQDPLGVADGVGDRGEVGALAVLGERDRVDEVGARALAAQLDQVGPAGVAEPVRALGVDGQRAGTGRECVDRGLQRLGRAHDRGDAVGGPGHQLGGGPSTSTGSASRGVCSLTGVAAPCGAGGWGRRRRAAAAGPTPCTAGPARPRRGSGSRRRG